jgi:hypothetical protein
VTTEERHGRDTPAQLGGSTCHVQALSAWNDHDAPRAVDLGDPKPVDLDQAIDRRVRRQADDPRA